MTKSEALALPTKPAPRAWRSLGVSLAAMVIALFVVMLAGEHVGLGPLDLVTADRIALALWAVAPVLGGALERRDKGIDLARAAISLGGLGGACVVLFFMAGAGTGDY